MQHLEEAGPGLHLDHWPQEAVLLDGHCPAVLGPVVDELLEEDVALDVGGLVAEDGDHGEAGLGDGLDLPPRECGALAQRVHFFEGEHLVAGADVAQAEGGDHHVDFLGGVAQLLVLVQLEDGDEVVLLEPLLVVVLAQPAVQQQADRPHQRVQHPDQPLHQRGHARRDLQLVLPRAVGLRNYLPEDQHAQGRQQDGPRRPHHSVYHDRQGLHRHRVQDQQRRQQHVVLVDQRRHPLHRRLVRLAPVRPDQLECQRVQRGVPHRQARAKGGRHQQQHYQRRAHRLLQARRLRPGQLLAELEGQTRACEQCA